MPKQSITYKNFASGVKFDVSKANLSIDEGELAYAQNVHYGGSADGDYDVFGDNTALKGIPDLGSAHPSDVTGEGLTGYLDAPNGYGGTSSTSSSNFTFGDLNPGQGLYFFSSDWDFTVGSNTLADGSDSSIYYDDSSSTSGGDNFILALSYFKEDGDTDYNGVCLLYSYGQDAWYAKFRDVTAGNWETTAYAQALPIDSPIPSASNRTANFTCWNPDGAVRISGGYFGISSSQLNTYVHWLGYVKRDSFGISNYSHSWFTGKNQLPAPTSARVVADLFDGYATGDYDSDINLEIDSGAEDSGDWQDGTYEIAVSYLYDNVGFLAQESKLYVPSANNSFTTNANSTLTIKAGIRARDTTDQYPTLNARVAGFRVYYREEDSDEWQLLVDGSMVSGIRFDMYSDYAPWVDANSSALEEFLATATSTGPAVDDFESINGFQSSEQDYHIQSHDTSATIDDTAIVNGRVFYSGVFRKVGAQLKIWGDRVFYSFPGKPDMCPGGNFLDIIPLDGDSITGMASYKDQLIVFKRKSMYVVNVADIEVSNWYLESKHLGLGIAVRSAYYETDKGVVWASDKGAFLWNEDGMSEISQGIRALWKNFNINKCNIMWMPDTEEIWFFKSLDGTHSTDSATPDADSGYLNSLIYNLRLESWTGENNADVFTIGVALPEVTDIDVNSGGTVSTGEYFIIYDADGKNTVQYRIDSESVPSVPGVDEVTNVLVAIKSTDDAKTVASRTAVAITDALKITGSVRDEKVVATDDSNAARTSASDNNTDFVVNTAQPGTTGSNNKSISNFVVDHNRYPVYMIREIAGDWDSHTTDKAYMKEIQPGLSLPANISGDIRYAETDFGDRMKLKRIYSIAVTHSTNSLSDENVLKYTKNGRTLTADIGTFGTSQAFPDANDFTVDYKRTMIKPASPIDCYTFQPIIKWTNGSTVIKDITIYYRVLKKTGVPLGTGNQVAHVSS